MLSLNNTFAACAIAAGLTVLAAPACAATIITNSGALPVGAEPGVTTSFGLPGGKPYNAANTYFFAFKLNETAAWQSQIAVQYTLKSSTRAPAPQPPAGSQSAPLAYSLFSGTCTAVTCTPSGSALAATAPGEQTLERDLAAGDYFLKLTSVTLPTLNPGWSYKLGPSLIGSYTTAAVPEPTTWALLLLGFAGAGAALRTRRRPALVTT